MIIFTLVLALGIASFGCLAMAVYLKVFENDKSFKSYLISGFILLAVFLKLANVYLVAT